LVQQIWFSSKTIYLKSQIPTPKSVDSVLLMSHTKSGEKTKEKTKFMGTLVDYLKKIY
jgi:hypothetical protein